MSLSLSYSKDASLYLHPNPSRGGNQYNDSLAQKYNKHRIEDLMDMYFGPETDGSYFPKLYELTVLTRAQNTMVQNWSAQNEGESGYHKKNQAEEDLHLPHSFQAQHSRPNTHSFSQTRSDTSNRNEAEEYFTPEEEEGDLESTVGGFSIASLNLEELDLNDSGVQEVDATNVYAKELNEKGSFFHYSQPKISDEDVMLPVNENENDENMPSNIRNHTSQIPTTSQEGILIKNAGIENTAIKRNEKVNDNIEIQIKIINIHDQKKLESTSNPSVTESSMSTTSGLSSTIVSMDKNTSPSRINNSSSKNYQSEYYARIAAQKTANVRSRSYLRRTRDTRFNLNSMHSELTSNREKIKQNNVARSNSTEETDMESHASSTVQELQCPSLNHSIQHHPLSKDTQSYASYSYAANSCTYSHVGAISYAPPSYNGDSVGGTTTKDDGLSVCSWNTNAFTMASGMSFYTTNESIVELKAMKRNIERAYSSIQSRIGIHCS